MWTSTLELNPRRVIITQLLGRFWRGAYFSSFAPLQVQNLPRQPLPASNWVRIRNHLAGICGSDLHLIYVDGDFRIAPAALPSHSRSYPGHEVVGEVIEVGDDVQHLHVGDRVVLQSGPNCISAGVQPLCRSCAIGNYNLCERGNLPGPKPIGGGWSEEIILHEQQLFRIPPDMSDEQAVLLEPTAVALHAVLRHLPQPGDHVLVIGAGSIGLLTLQVIRALAPQTRVSVMARHAFQVEQATRMGASYILYPQDAYESVKLTTGAQLYQGMFGNKMLLGGYDAIYDTIGTRGTLHDALRWTRAGGTIVMVGLSLRMMNIDLTPIWYQEINLIGTLAHGMETWPIGTSERRSTFAIATDMIEQGQLHPEKLITHHFALNNYQHALSTASAKSQSRAIKVVFDYALLPATTVPNVRATARQRPRHRATTTATWQPADSLELPTTDEQPMPAEPSWTPVSVPAPQSSVIEQPEYAQAAEAIPTSSPLSTPENDSEEDPRTVIVPKPRRLRTTTPSPSMQSTETPQTPPSTHNEDENPATVVVPKPKRARQTITSQKTTEDIPPPLEATDNSAVTNAVPETLPEIETPSNTQEEI